VPVSLSLPYPSPPSSLYFYPSILSLPPSLHARLMEFISMSLKTPLLSFPQSLLMLNPSIMPSKNPMTPFG
jgi:hypothetical protein